MFTHTCGVREREVMPGTVARWPMAEVTYFEDLVFAGLTRDQIAAAYDQAAQLWADQAGIAFRRVDSIYAANIVAHSGPIDGPYGVLALSDLPYGATDTSQMSQTFDASEPWSIEGLDMLVSCICHEIGHALGLEHIPGVGALMDPYIVPGRDKPQPPDVAAMRSLYGPPVVTPPASVPKPVPTEEWELFGRNFAPYALGPICDGWMTEADDIAVGVTPSQAREGGRDYVIALLDDCYAAIVAPRLAALNVADRPQALRLMAKGLAGSLSK